MEYLKLKAKMKEYGDTQMDLAQVIGVSLSRFNAKINRADGADFTLKEIRQIKHRYALNAEDVDEIFFNIKVS